MSAARGAATAMLFVYLYSIVSFTLLLSCITFISVNSETIL